MERKLIRSYFQMRQWNDNKWLIVPFNVTITQNRAQQKKREEFVINNTQKSSSVSN